MSWQIWVNLVCQLFACEISGLRERMNYSLRTVFRSSCLASSSGTGVLKKTTSHLTWGINNSIILWHTIVFHPSFFLYTHLVGFFPMVPPTWVGHHLGSTRVLALQMPPVLLEGGCEAPSNALVTGNGRRKYSGNFEALSPSPLLQLRNAKPCLGHSHPDASSA